MREVELGRMNERRRGLWLSTPGMVGFWLLIGLLVQPAVTRGAEGEAVAKAPWGLARYVPEKGLFTFLEFDGVGDHAEAWQKSAAYKLVTETTLNALLEDLASQVTKLPQASLPPGFRVAMLSTAELKTIAFSLLKNGFVIGSWSEGEPRPPGVVVVAKGVESGAVKLALEVMAAEQRKGMGIAAKEAATRVVSGRTVHSLDATAVWWFEKGDLVISNKPEVVIGVLDGKAANTLKHPLLARLTSKSDEFEPMAVAFFDMAALPPLPPDAKKMGLDGLKHFDFQWGVQDNALRTVVHVEAPSPRRGVLSMFELPTFDMKSLPRLPSDLRGFTVLSIDLSKLYDRLISLMKQTEPQAEVDQIPVVEEMIRQQLGVNVREELLPAIGTKLALYSTLPEGAGGNLVAQMVTQYSGLTVGLQVEKSDVVARALEPIVEMLNQQLARNAGPNGAIEFRKVDGAVATYVMDFPPNLLPPPFSTMFRPTIVLTRNQLIVAASSAAADRAAGLTNKTPAELWKPDDAYLPVIGRLPKELVFLSVDDSRVTIPAMVQSLPILVQQLNTMMPAVQAGRGPGVQRVAPPRFKLDMSKMPKTDELVKRLFPATTSISIDETGLSLVMREAVPSLTSPSTSAVLVALLLPAVQSAREAARRAQCVNNEKQIGLAMHNYHSANNAFPKSAITDKDGKPLLSWRVAILPYIEKGDLYNRFHLDEPWDSPHNKQLLKEMPQTYICPSRAYKADFTTTYQVMTGAGAMFQKDAETGIQQVTDGTSNSIMVVEAAKAVPWTKPDDVAFDAAAIPSLYGAGSNHPGGFNAVFGDGSVRFIKTSISVNVFKALVTIAGGEVISSDSF